MLKSLTTICGVQLQFNDTEVLAFAVKNEVPDGSDFFVLLVDPHNAG